MIPRTTADAGAIGKQLIAAMGGADAWQRVRYVRFDSRKRAGAAPATHRAPSGCRRINKA